MRTGHVFQGRYKAILVEKNAYLQELSRYIILNPVRAAMVESAENWRWSSYGITIGIHYCPKWFDREWVLGSFGKREKAAIRNYIQFKANGVQQPSPWAKLKSQIYLGSDDFVNNVQTHISKNNLSEVPKIQKRAIPKPLEEYEKNSNNRNEVIALAYRSGGFTLAEIGRYYSTVSRIVHNKAQE